VEQHLTAGHLRASHRGPKGRGGFVIERSEQWRLTHDVVVHLLLLTFATPERAFHRA
jgi:hypothetical protein